MRRAIPSETVSNSFVRRTKKGWALLVPSSPHRPSYVENSTRERHLVANLAIDFQRATAELSDCCAPDRHSYCCVPSSSDSQTRWVVPLGASAVGWSLKINNHPRGICSSIGLSQGANACTSDAVTSTVSDEGDRKISPPCHRGKGSTQIMPD